VFYGYAGSCMRTSENSYSTTFMNKAVAFCIRARESATNPPTPTQAYLYRF
jgi:hypothetical protein